MTQPILRAGSAHLWFFRDKQIVDWQASVQKTDAVVGEPQAVYSTDCLPMVFDQAVSDPKSRLIRENDFYAIAPEQQLNDLKLKMERDTLDLMTQYSSKPVAYSRTGLNVTVELSIADITLKNLALAFGVDVDNDGISEYERVSLTDQASKLIPTFGLLVIPQPFFWKGDSSKSNDISVNDPLFTATVSDSDKGRRQAVNWRNSWVYLPQASIVQASPNLVYGIKTQQEIKVNIIGLPDLRPDRSSINPFIAGEIDYEQTNSYANFDRAVLGYPRFKQSGSIHDPDVNVS